jgi:excisionase family DNA binding protein
MARNAAMRVGTLDERLPQPDEVSSARELLDFLPPLDESAAPVRIGITHLGRTGEFAVSPAVGRTLVSVLRMIASGQAVTIVPVGATLTTQQAADMLNVSRPYFIKLLESGEIGFEKVGRHRRVNAAELLAYKNKRDRRRRQALADMAAMDAIEGDL